MNENPSGPGSPGPQPPIKKDSDLPKRPSFGLMFGLGVLFVIVSAVFCAATGSITPLCLTGILAFMSLFFRGYRGFFAGAATVVGVVLLGLAIFCGATGMPNFH